MKPRVSRSDQWSPSHQNTSCVDTSQGLEHAGLGRTIVWPTVRLDEHLEFLTSGSRGWSQYVREQGVMFLRIQNVGYNKLMLDDVAFVEPPVGAETERTRVQSGDILLSITADLGRTAVIPSGFGPAHINQHLAILRVRDFDPRFVAAFISIGPGRRQLETLDRGGVKSGLNFNDVRSLKIPRPPIDEQRRIADILDKADAIRRKRKEAIALTEELLRSTFLDMFGDPVTNPKRWSVKPLGEVVERLESGWSANGDARQRDQHEYGVLKISAVTAGIFKPDEHKAVAASAIDRELVMPRAGDLLFSRANTRELVAATCLVEHDAPRLFLPDKIWRVVPREGAATPPYLRFLLAHERFRERLTNTATGTSGSMLNVSMNKFRGMLSPMPPFDLQQRFAALVWKVLRTRAQAEDAERDTCTLFASLVARSFSGGLAA